VQRAADTLLHASDPGRWNEAVMDLGATVCVPKTPRCGECPLRTWCAAYATGRPGDFPAPKRRAEVRELTLVAVLIGNARHAYLEEREGTLLGGLSGLPAREVGPDGPGAALQALLGRLGAREPRPLGTVTHVMTHRRLTLHVYEADADLPRHEVAARPLSQLDRKALALADGPRPLLTS
jgi:A/G-specific adenine glycosylase